MESTVLYARKIHLNALHYIKIKSRAACFFFVVLCLMTIYIVKICWKNMERVIVYLLLFIHNHSFQDIEKDSKW